MIRYRGCIFAALTLALCFGCVRSAADVSAVSPSAVPVTEAPTPAPTEEPTPTPSPTTTPSPTPTPTPEPTPEPITEERLQSCEFDFFFDDAVFVGDSVTRTFNNYANARRKTEEGFLGEARFMGAVAMSVMNASSNRAYPGGITFTVRGKPVSVTEGLNLLEAKKAFILLGGNDIGFRSWDAVEGYYARLIDLIHEQCPDTEVILQGVFPVTRDYCRTERVRIERWNSFNEILARVCDEHGATFLNFSDQLKDEDGYLPDAFSSDRRDHLSEKGEEIWVRALRLFAAQRLYPDAAVILSESE